MRIAKNKIKSPQELKKIISRLKKQGKKIAFTNGCFDILHYGHVSYLEKAKRLTDILVIAINSDSSMRRIKGKTRPILNLGDRMGIIAALECVDFITSFNQDTPREIIKLLKPDMLIKGGDWNRNEIVGKNVVESYGGKVKTIPYIKGQSTTKIINRLLGQNKN